jgi:hypothetical protein
MLKPAAPGDEVVDDLRSCTRTTTKKCVTDLARGTSTVTKICASFLHDNSDNIAADVFANFPALLTAPHFSVAGKNPKTISSTLRRHSVALSDASSLQFFICRIKSNKKYHSVAFHTLFEKVVVAPAPTPLTTPHPCIRNIPASNIYPSSQSVAPTRKNPSPPSASMLIYFRTTTSAEAANNMNAPPDHLAAVATSLAEITGKAGKPPTDAAAVYSINGALSLKPMPFSCTEATLSVSASVQVEAVQGGALTPFASFGTNPNSPLAESNPRAVDVIDLLLLAVPSLRAKFSRNDEVDEATLHHFETVEIPSSPPLLTHENELVDTSILYDDQDTNTDWHRTHGTIGGYIDYFQKMASGESGWGKGVSEVDAPAARALGWIWFSLTHERVQEHLEKNGDLPRKEIEVPGSHSKAMIVVQKLPANLANRVYSTMFTWRQEPDGSFSVGFADTRDCKQFGAAAAEANDFVTERNKDAVAAVRGSSRGIWRIEPRAPGVCRVSLVSQGTVGGSIPLIFMKVHITKNIGITNRIRKKYERNSKEVDAELRAVFPIPPPLGQLSADQATVMDSGLALEADADAGDSKDLQSPSPLVDMSMAYTPPLKGERSIALGNAKVLVDAQARQIVAWYFEYCSRTRTVASAEKGDPARIVVRRFSPHDAMFATVKCFPFPLSKREFVFRVIAAQDDSGTFIVASSSTSRQHVVDYGTDFKAVRGFTTALLKVKPVGPNSCECVLLQKLDAGGALPAAVVNRKVPSQLGVLSDLRLAFQRDEEIDAAERARLARTIEHELQNYAAEERALLERVESSLGALKKADLVELDSPDPLVKMHCILVEGESSTIMMATTTVDSSVEECAAWDLLKLSREQLRRSKNVEITLNRTNSHHSVFHFVKDLGVPGFTPREWILESVWMKRGPDTLLTAYEHFPEHASFKRNPKYLRGTSSVVFYKYQRLPPIGAVPQTRVSFTQQVDLGGVIPRWVVDKAGVKQLMYLSRMRTKFDKSLEIDAANRARKSGEMKIFNHATAYSKEENEIVQSGLGNFTVFGEGRAKKLKMALSATAAKILFEKGGGSAKGWASSVVRASPEDILTFIWDTMSRTKRRGDDLEKAVDAAPNGHNQLVYNRKRTVKVIDDRDFLGRIIWKKVGTVGSAFVVASRPEESAERPRLRGVVRGKYPNTFKITPLSRGKTKVEYVVSPEWGGQVPRWVSNLYIASNLARVTDIQMYFQSLRGLAQWDEQDGKDVGEIMAMRTKAEKYHERGETKIGARIRELFERDKGLGEISKQYEFLEPMMARVVENKLRPAGDVCTRMCSVSKKEGRTMGAGLAMSLASNLTAEAAVDEWILKYPALRELEEAEVWFRPMMNAVALRLLGEVSWGLKMRVFLGAGLSILDMATDVNVLLLYRRTPGQEGYGLSLMWMVIACIALQLLAVFVQYRKTSRAKLSKEILIVLTGLKPGFDAFRVAGGKEIEEGNTVDPKVELVAGKCSELLAESIPGEP